MLAECGVNVDHSTIYRWVQRYAPEMEKRLRWYWHNPYDFCPWHIDETYVKVNSRWAYLYRAVDNRGRTVDFTSLRVVIAKPHTGSWVKSSTTLRSSRSPGLSTRIKRPAMDVRLHCSNAKVDARLTLNTDRLSIGITSLNVIMAN